MIKTLQRISVSRNVLNSRIIYSLNSVPSQRWLSRDRMPNNQTATSVPTAQISSSYHAFETHQFQEILMPRPANFVHDLAGGRPEPNILESSMHAINKATDNLIKRANSIYLLDYGDNPGPARMVEQLSMFLSRRYSTAVAQEWLFSMAGASQSISFLPHILGPLRGGKVFIEHPTYMHAIDTFTLDNKYDIVPVESDEFGVVPSSFKLALETHLKDSKTNEGGVFASILYLQIAFANPGGWSVPKQRMIEIEEIAKEWNILVLADDVYSFTNFAEEADKAPYLPSTATRNGEISDYVVTLGSFSKLIAPGLRFGWLVASKRIMDIVNDSGFIRSGGCPNYFVANLIGELIADGTADVLTDRGRQSVKKRMEIAEGIFKAHLPGNVKFTAPKGGFFSWVEVPKPESGEYDSVCLADVLNKRYGVKVVDGINCQLPEVYKKSRYWTLRVTLTTISEEEIPFAVRALCDAISDFLGFKPSV